MTEGNSWRNTRVIAEAFSAMMHAYARARNQPTTKEAYLPKACSVKESSPPVTGSARITRP